MYYVEELLFCTYCVLFMYDGRITNVGLLDQVIIFELLSRMFGCKVFVKKIYGCYWLEVLFEVWFDLVWE